MNATVKSMSLWFAAGLIGGAFFWSAGISKAQGSTSGPISNPLTQMDATQADEQMQEAYLRQTLGDPKEEAAYQAFHKTTVQNADKKIKLGQAFINKYPHDPYTEIVYQELLQTYYAKQDLPDFYMCSDKGISQFPDDVPLLALTSWVLPRTYTHDDADGEKKLEKSETYAKHALATLGTLARPDNLSEQQFGQYKTSEAAVAHSGLGLVYFRRGRFEDSVKELQTAIQNEAKPDQSDYYVLGADFENLSRYKDAADAFGHCAEIGGSLQENCKKFSAEAQHAAAQAQ
jgi:tetratricopeptide (TPR) repeat protein